MDSTKYPFPPAFEQQVAILAAQSTTFWSRAAQHLDPARFSNPLCGLIVAATKEFKNHPGGMIPVLTALRMKVDKGALKRAIYDSIEELHLSVDVGPANEEPALELLIPLLKDDAKRAVAEKVVTDYGATGIDTTTTIAALERIDTIGADHQVSSEIEFTSADLDLAYEHMHGEKCPFGIPPLDVIMEGGAEIGSLSVFVANPGQGKSLALTNVAVSAMLEGLNVFYVSNELSRADVIGKLVPNLTDTTIAEAQKNKKQTDERLGYWRSRGLGRLEFVKYEAGEHTVGMIRDALRMAERKNNLRYRVVIVDYADQTLSGAKYAKDDTLASRGHEDAKRVYAKLRAIAGEQNGWVFTASQPKAGQDGKASMDLNALAGSVAKAQKTDNVITMPRTDADINAKLIRFQVAKRRLKALPANSAMLGPFPIEFDKCRPVQVVRDAPWNRTGLEHIAPRP